MFNDQIEILEVPEFLGGNAIANRRRLFRSAYLRLDLNETIDHQKIKVAEDQEEFNKKRIVRRERLSQLLINLYLITLQPILG